MTFALFDICQFFRDFVDSNMLIVCLNILISLLTLSIIISIMSSSGGITLTWRTIIANLDPRLWLVELLWCRALIGREVCRQWPEVTPVSGARADGDACLSTLVVSDILTPVLWRVTKILNSSHLVITIITIKLLSTVITREHLYKICKHVFLTTHCQLLKSIQHWVFMVATECKICPWF